MRAASLVRAQHSFGNAIRLRVNRQQDGAHQDANPFVNLTNVLMSVGGDSVPQSTHILPLAVAIVVVVLSPLLMSSKHHSQ